MKQPLVSVIIPAYNAEKYIGNCITSIKNQTYQNIEIIVIDDGSTDETESICNKYAKEDVRIYVIHQKNQGRVSARNQGVKIAKGQYILFVDADDWIDTDMISMMSKMILKYDVDLVVTGYFKEIQGKTNIILEPIEENIYDSEEDMEYLISNFLFLQNKEKSGMIKSQWGKLYQRNILLEIIDIVPKELKFNEDCLLNFLYLQKVKSVYVSKNAYYHYRIHAESTVGSICEDYLIQINLFYLEMKKIIKGMKNHVLLLQQLEKMVVEQTMLGLNGKLGLSKAIHIPRYFFDFSELENKSVVVYGGGVVGVDFVQQLQLQSSINLVLWVDKNFEQIKQKYSNVKNVSEIQNVEYDLIFIAIQSEVIANEIKKQLVEEYFVKEDCIKWKKPISIFDMNI